ncbi:MAG: hypothetical protein ACYC69_14410 [Thermodesulfovibrionales bacterium]
MGIVIYHELWFLEYYHLPPITFIQVDAVHSKLINGIESYQSINDFKGFLARNSLQWEESEDNPSPRGRPPFNVHTITLKNYSHLGFSDVLEIKFINNRLMSTTFRPAVFEKYVETLAKEGIKFDNKQEAKLSPYTIIRVATDYKGRKYIKWSDIRLDKEVDLWIKRYS